MSGIEYYEALLDEMVLLDWLSGSEKCKSSTKRRTVTISGSFEILVDARVDLNVPTPPPGLRWVVSGAGGALGLGFSWSIAA